MRIKLIYIIICLTVFITGCNEYNEPNTSDKKDIIEGKDTIEEINYITYEEAFEFMSDAEKAIKRSNAGLGTNKYGKSATEAIIYSDEYAGLYCAYWGALEKIGEPNEERFTKSKLRWDMDYTNKEWQNILIQAYEQKGEDAFYSKYGDLYQEKVFDIVNKTWRK